MRKFLIRRKLSLEVLYTNGLIYWTEFINQSDVSPPYNITDITLSKDNTKLIAAYSPQENESIVKLRFFKANAENKFVYNDDQALMGITNLKNIYIDKLNDVTAIQIELCKFSSNKRGGNALEHIHVRRVGNVMIIGLPKFIFFKNILDDKNSLDRFMISANGRLLMSGKIVIQLNSSLTNVEQIGCIIATKHHSILTYKFYSLIDKNQNLMIKQSFDFMNKQIVEFKLDNEPVSPKGRMNIMYCLNITDSLAGETSIMKIETNSLHCQEIY